MIRRGRELEEKGQNVVARGARQAPRGPLQREGLDDAGALVHDGSMHFHIHIDAATVSREFEVAAKNAFGFARDDFTPIKGLGPGGYPCNHLSRKFSSAQEFHQNFDGITRLASALGGVVGYIEGECVVRRAEICATGSLASAQPPFFVKLCELPPGAFRETEIHVTAHSQRVSPPTAKALTEAGFLQAHKGSPADGKRVFTLQGDVLTIRPLYDIMVHFLTSSGVLGDCTIKEERIVRYWMSHAEAMRPPVVYEVCDLRDSLA